MKVITLSNMKGGVAKSITSVALANGLHDKGYRVLLCDMDPQSNAAFMSGLDVLEVDLTLFDIFKDSFGGEADIKEAILPVRFGFDVAISGLKATAADMAFAQQMGRELVLKEVLKPIQDNYDFVICDTSPNLGILTTAAAVAADFMIVPMTADPFALSGATQLDAYMRNIRKYYNPDLRVLGILLTMYNNRSTLAKSLEAVIQSTAADMDTEVFNTRIRRAQALQDAASVQQDMYATAAKAKATQDYKEFVAEVLQRIERR